MISKIIIIGWTAFVAWAFIAGMGDVMATNPSDTLLGFTIMFSCMFHLLVWLVVALPTYMLSRMFARKSHAPVSSS